MIKNSLYYGIDKKYHVEFQIDNDSKIYKGELNLSPGKAPYLSIEKDFLKNDNSVIKMINCKSKTTSFLLLDSDNYTHILYPKYIIKGQPFDNYKEIKFAGLHLYLSNYYKWIINDRVKNPNTSNKIIKFDVKVEKTDSKFIKISNSYNYSIKEDEIEKRKSLIEKYPTIDISCINDTFSIDDIFNLSYEMKQIFSYLMGYSLNILYLWGYITKKYNNKEYEEWIPIYSSSIFKNQEILESKRDSFIKAEYINKKKWEDIFTNFYSQDKYKNFKLRWSRLIGLLDYNDIWDYEIAGYVSLFESQLDKFKSKQNNLVLPIGEDEFKEFKENLNSKIDDFLNLNMTKKQQKKHENVSQSMKGYISKLRNYDYPTLMDKYDRWISTIDNRVKDIIDLNRNDFKLVKKFKDATSHANKLNYDNNDINNFFVTKNKISLFLFYLIYCELGFTSKEFIKFLNYNMHPLKLNAHINQEALDKTIGEILFIEINKNDFDNKNYSFNSEKTNEYKKNYGNEIKKYKFTEDYIKELYKNKKFKNVKYIGTIYITNQNLSKSLRLHSVFFVELPSVLS